MVKKTISQKSNKTPEKTLYQRSENITEKILKLLEENGPLTRNEICIKLGYVKRYWGYEGHTSIKNRLAKLVRQNKIIRFPAEIRMVGRPPIFYRLPEEDSWDSLT